jgi:cellulose synthase/poly-beta-1,6-N-acetylglucosamine synthase-like glycosyltransferase
MEMLVSCTLVIAAGLIAIPVAVFLLEIVAAIALPQWQPAAGSSHGTRHRLAVLVPAHNESTGLLATLADIRNQLHPGDRLLVVADNCTDDTAAVAVAGGAEVAERHDTDKQGKGYALDFGLRHLNSNPPEIVIMIDADCRLADDTIDRLATTCAITRRPVQALYLMAAPKKSPINHQVAEFAWRVKNWLRPVGLSALKLPCQLVGTGMAFPWDVIRSADLANGLIVEDVKLGLDLTLAGKPPLFCPSACVRSEFASSVGGAGSQRKRWEQGHIGMILTTAPRLLWVAIAQRNWALLGLTLDLGVPPLSLLALLLVGMFAVAGLAVALGFSSAALTVSIANLLAFVVAAFLSWMKCGRDILPLVAMLSIALYVYGKLPLYRHILSNRTEPGWVRTDRTKSHVSARLPKIE